MGKQAGIVATLAVCMMLFSCIFWGCSGQNGSSSPSDASASGSAASTSASTSSSAIASQSGTSSGTSAQSGASSEASAERQAEIERLTGLEEAYNHTLEVKDDWADGVVVDALNKLAEQGAIAPLPDDFQLFEKVFQFEPVEGGYDVAFLDNAAKEQVTGDFSLDLSDGSKVALCTELHMLNDDGSRARDVTVPYTDKDGKFSTSVKKHDEALLATPTLMPGGWAGTYASLQSDVPQEVFADNIEECRYLIAYGSCYSNVEKDYYSVTLTSEGSIDRTDVTTVVLVIDAREHRILHIENIGTSVPEGSVDAAKAEHYGKQLTGEAIAYIKNLLE